MFMRQLLSFLVLLICLSAAAQKQPNHYTTSETKDHKHIPTTKFGFKAGYNGSDISGVETNGAKTGYVGGELYGAFFGDSEISKRLNLGYELLVSWTNDYHFVEIPVHLKYNFTHKWSTFAGPKLDFLADAINQYKKFALSAEAGVQYNISRRFFGEARYARGLTRQVNDPFLDINRATRNTMRVGIGVRF